MFQKDRWFLQEFLRIDWLKYSSMTKSFNLFINTNPIRVLNIADQLFFVSHEPLSRLRSYVDQLLSHCTESWMRNHAGLHPPPNLCTNHTCCISAGISQFLSLPDLPFLYPTSGVPFLIMVGASASALESPIRFNSTSDRIMPSAKIRDLQQATTRVLLNMSWWTHWWRTSVLLAVLVYILISQSIKSHWGARNLKICLLILSKSKRGFQVVG